MSNIIYSIAVVLFTPLLLLAGSERAIYNSLDPLSVAETLAFCELYPEAEETAQAMKRIEHLLKLPNSVKGKALFSLINPLKGSSSLSESDIALIESIAKHLPNRQLKGYTAHSETEVIALSSDQIDLGMALILSQMGEGSEAYFQARSYSAMLDLMALQILARLPKEATALQKIHETNRFIFDQMHFRFPPQSVYAENIDLYTFLPSVMDNHLGVCLGVTALYLAIAQRIDLPLEIITPPGHIYIRYRVGEKTVNIETTARGVHMPDETYLSLHNATLQQRSLKEVIGMTHVNQASTYLYKGEFCKAAHIYEKACPYMPKDPLVNELLGYTYLFTEKKVEGENLLKEIGKGLHTIAEDYLAGKVNLDGITAVFTSVDETRSSLIEKQKKLEVALEKYPAFREGLHQLATTWIQLNRSREAIAALTQFYTLDPNDAVTNYYLAALHAERYDFKNAWHYLKCAEKVVSAQNFTPQALVELRRTLNSQCPE
jgi:tetratricopeptide (TPR) repeat protein